MQKIEAGKIYKHYKGNLYRILCFAKHSETMEDMVVYSSVKEGLIWVRSKAMWNDVIDKNGTLRFTLIEQ